MSIKNYTATVKLLESKGRYFALIDMRNQRNPAPTSVIFSRVFHDGEQNELSFDFPNAFYFKPNGIKLNEIDMRDIMDYLSRSKVSFRDTYRLRDKQRELLGKFVQEAQKILVPALRLGDLSSKIIEFKADNGYSFDEHIPRMGNPRVHKSYPQRSRKRLS